MTSDPTCIGIVGGGIGGLTAAIALRRAGFAVTVFERSLDRRREGVALILWANAIHALARLGLIDEVMAVAAPLERTEVRRDDGELLCDLAITAPAPAAGCPTVALRRPQLVEILTRALPPEVIRAGTNVVGIAQDQEGVTVRFADGADARLAALIGADGLRSLVREQLFGPDPPRLLEQDAWVATVHQADDLFPSGAAVATIGHGPRFWAAPLTKGGAFWYATLSRGSSLATDGGFPAAAFADWHTMIPRLIARTATADIVHTRIADRPPTLIWGRGRITLLGDAIHPSTPDLGQGACQAIESAVVLGACLAPARSLADGFRRYEARRRDRTASISNLCWLIASTSTAENPLFCRLRDASIRLALKAIARRNFDWLLEPPAC